MWLCSGTYSRVTGISRFARQAGVMSYLLFWTAMGPPGLGGGCGSDSRQLLAQAEDRPARCRTHSPAADGKPVSAIVGAERGAAGSSAVADSPPQVSRNSDEGEERVAASGAESGSPKAFPVMERSGEGLFRRTSPGRLDCAAARRFVEAAGGVRPALRRVRRGSEPCGRGTSAGPAADDSAGSWADNIAGICVDHRRCRPVQAQQPGGQLSWLDSPRT